MVGLSQLRSAGFLGSCLAAFCLCLLTAQLASAQKLKVRRLGVAEGLASTTIRDLAQDSSGRLWIATSGGISVFDGLEAQNFGLGDGLLWSDQRALGWDSEGRLLTASSQPPFPVYQRVDGRFEALSEPPSSVHQTLSSFVVSTRNDFIALGTEKGISILADGEWHWLTKNEGLAVDAVSSLVEWNGRLVAGSREGLVMLRGTTIDHSLDARINGAPSRDIRGLAVEDDRLWVVGRDWIGQLDEQRWTQMSSFLDLGLPAEPRGQVEVVADRLGGIYLAADGILRHVARGRRSEIIDAARGVDVGPVRALLLDREGHLWIGGDNGLVQLADRRFSSLRQTDGLYDSKVVALHQRSDGTMVLGHRGGLSFVGSKVDSLSLDLSSTDGRRLEQIRDIAEDESGNLWLAADTRGLGHLGPAGEVRWAGVAEGLPGAVTAVLQDSRRRLWVGTDEGVFRYRDGKFESLGGNAEGAHVRRLVEAPGGALLIATTSGLLHFEESSATWQSWSCERASCASVFGVAADSAGHWVATADGLYRAPIGGGELIASLHPEVSQPIFFAVRQGARLWLGTEDGVLRVNPGTARVERLSVEQGLAGRETFRAAALVDASGRLWLGTDMGLSSYEARFERPPPPPPVVELVSLTMDGSSYPLDRPIDLPFGAREVIFKFRAVTLSSSEKLRFRSWIEGVDSGWLPPYTSEAQELRVASLASGEYRFHLQAALAAGEWSPPIVSAPFRVRAPFFRQSWFLGLAIAFVLAAFYAVPSVVLQRRHFRHLAGEVTRRTAELRASEERYKKTFRAIEDGVLTTDEEGCVALLNPGAEAITGWPEEAAVGRAVEDVLQVFQSIGDEKTGPPVPLLSGAIQDTMGPTRSVVLRNRQGERRSVELTTAPIISGGGFTGLVFIFRDISGKKLVEAELARAQKLEAVGILAGGIAHDFNNLLTVLLGNLSLVRESGRLESDDERLLQDGEIALMRARDLTHQLLTFSSGGAPVREAASISEVIRDSASFVLSGSNVRCRIDLEPDLWVVEIDAGQISQVLNNLLINGSQAMPQGGEIRITGRNVTKVAEPLADGRYVRIDVVDTGIGIAANVVERIFDPYFSTKEEGRGLGLASAYSIVKNHDGLLTVDSILGKGTSFHIFLPASQHDMMSKNRSHDSSYRGFGRVLVMDDDPVVRRTSGAMLERLGFEVTFSEDGRQAIALYQQAIVEDRRFLVVMMDLTVPGGMGGQAAMKRLLAIDPNVRAVVYSGYSNDPVLANHLDYGFAGRLSKPFRLRELRRVFENILK